MLKKILLASLVCTAIALADTPPGAPEAMSEATYTSAPFIALLEKYVNADGNVNYAAWKQSANDMAILKRQVDTIALISPHNHPEIFPDKSAERSYWINAYNTLVVQAVLDLWPLESVRDVKITLTSRLVPGKGFFYDREVVVGGLKTNLYKLENDIIRKQVKDPRIHFSLNCASDSCPVMKPSDWTDSDLEAAAHDFINNPDNVAVKDGKVWLSRIFKWYKKDFPADLYGYLQVYAEPQLHSQLQIAGQQHYPHNYFEYDWGLNNASAGSH